MEGTILNMFNEILDKMNLRDLLRETQFKPILPIGARKFSEIVKEIVNNPDQPRVWIDGDCDCDGYLSAREVQLMFDALGFTNYGITCHTYKRHNLNTIFYKNLLDKEKPDYVFVLDSSSNNIELMNISIQRGVKLIIIDHHVSTLNRKTLPDNITVINPMIDSYEMGKESPLNDMACGTIMSLLVEFVMRTQFPKNYYKLNNEHWVCGYITLYSDSCPFNFYNIAYAKMILNSNFSLPPYVDVFKTKYNTLSKKFVSWTFVPRINAMIREEEFELVHEFIFNFNSFIQTHDVQEVFDIHLRSKSFTDKLKEKSELISFPKYKIAFIPDKPRARNYTGLVAQRFVSEYNVPVLGLVRTDDTYQGSVRVPFDVNLLSPFKLVCYAEGHDSAFGIEFPVASYKEITYTLDSILRPIEISDSVSNDTLFLSLDKFSSSDKELLDDLKNISVYNEFCGRGIPSVFVTLTLNRNHSIYRSEKYTRIKWGSLSIISFKGYPAVGDKLIMKPEYSVSNTPDLIVETILIGGK